MPVTLAPAEHLRYEWLPWREAAERTISATNREAILMLPDMLSRTDL
jgi:dATP pyrophosphohydrolase